MQTIQTYRFSLVISARIAILWCLMPWAWNQVSAQDGAVPSWQKGVSVWNGKGRDAASSTTSTNLSLNSPVANSAVNPPYTVPVDPANPPSLETGSTPFIDLSASLPIDDATTDAISRLTFATVNSTDTESSKSESAGQPSPPAPVTTETPKKIEISVDAATENASSSSEPSLPPLGETIAGIDSIPEQAPLQDEVVRWYQYPVSWMKGWDSHAEFGLDGSSGNADTLALQTGFEMRRQTELYTVAIDVDYRNARNQSVTIEDNGRFNTDLDRMIQSSPWSAFGKYGLEWDKFKAFDLRLNVNGGLAYHFIREDTAAFATRFGAGGSKEIGAPDDDWVPEAVFGVDALRQINTRHKLKAKVDYFPAWEDFDNFRLVADASWEILLDDTENFSLKLAATDRYDSTPQGAKHNDVYYSLLLLYKF